MPNITRLGSLPSPPSGSKALKHSAHHKILPTCQQRQLRHREVKPLVPVEQSGCLRRVRRGLLKAGARGLCELRPRTKLLEPPLLTPVTGALPFPARAWPSPLARRVGSGGQPWVLRAPASGLSGRWGEGEGRTSLPWVWWALPNFRERLGRGGCTAWRCAASQSSRLGLSLESRLPRQGKSAPELEKVRRGHHLSHRWC